MLHTHQHTRPLDYQSTLISRSRWDVQNHEDMLAAKERRQEVKASLRTTLPPEEKAELGEHKILHDLEWNGFKEAREQLRLKQARQDKKTFDKAYNLVSKQRTYQSRLIHNEKDNLLKKFGIDRGASHGGDLQGRGCTNLLQEADDFFDQCLVIDLRAIHEGTALATQEEATLVNTRFRKLAILLNRLFHFMMMDHYAVKKEYISADAFVHEVEVHVDILVAFWNSYPSWGQSFTLLRIIW
jgi:hypothetical protein